MERKRDEAVVARRARFLKRLLHAAVSSDSLENLTFSPHLALKVRSSSSRSAYDTAACLPLASRAPLAPNGRGTTRVRVTDGIRLRRDRDEDEAGGVRREVPGLPAALEVVVGPDLHLLHLVRMQQVLDAAQVLRRRGASIGGELLGLRRERGKTHDRRAVRTARQNDAVIRARDGEERHVPARCVRHGLRRRPPGNGPRSFRIMRIAP